MPRVIERYFEDNLADELFQGQNEYVVHIGTCDGKFQEEFSAVRHLAEASEKFQISLIQMKSTWREHGKIDCEMLGSFCGCGSFGFLFLHAGDDCLRESKEETLENMRLAARDMLAKLPKNCTVHSQSFSFQHVGGPTWPEIRSVFDQALVDTPNVSWVFWRTLSSLVTDGIDCAPTLKTSLDVSQNLNSLETGASRSRPGSDGSDESWVANTITDGGNSTESREEDANVPKNVEGKEELVSCCENQLYNVRNSFELTKPSKSEERKRKTDSVRMSCCWFHSQKNRPVDSDS